MAPLRLRVLQIFNRYLQYGGEEGSVYRIGDALQQLHDVEYFLYSTAELIGKSSSKWMALSSVFYNRSVLEKLRRYQQLGKFQIWQIHNVFPAMSPVVYAEAFRNGIPIVHYLHNYRMSCVNGMFLNHGEACQRCIGGNFWPAFQTGCWHDSKLQSGLMGLVMSSVRRLQVFEKVERWVAISQAQKAIHVRMGLPEERIHVIHHFYEPKGPPAPQTQARDVLFVGRLSPEKGVRQLLKAWRLLKPGRARLRIVGDGPERARLEDWVRDEAVAGVVFEGFKKHEEMSAIWSESLCTAVPSIWEETFGMTVLESWAQGRAVIGSAIGSLPELIRHGETGLLAGAGDAEDWAKTLDHALTHPDAMLAMGTEGRRCLEREFNQATWLKKIHHLYEQIPFRR